MKGPINNKLLNSIVARQYTVLSDLDSAGGTPSGTSSKPSSVSLVSRKEVSGTF